MAYFVSPQIIFGEEALEELSKIEGKHALIVTDKFMVKFGYVKRVQELLQMESTVFDEVEPDPSYETVMKGVEIISKTQSDIIIGLGGGSPMDVAKTIRILYEKPDLAIEDIAPMVEVEIKKTKLILIPTTSGTGAEVTTAIVLTRKDEERKAPTANFAAMADIAIIDPSLAKNMPPALTANTGMDALCHSIDGYISTLKNDFSDGLCIKAAEMIFEYLPRAYQNREDKEAREKMHIAASIAGLGFGNSQAGLSHGMGHSLGAVFHLPHGKACGISLPYSLQYLDREPEVMTLLAKFAYHLGIQKETEEESVKELVEKIFDLMTAIDIPHFLKAEISPEDFKSKLEKLVENAIFDGTIVFLRRTPDTEELKKLFEYAYEGKEIDF